MLYWEFVKSEMDYYLQEMRSRKIRCCFRIYTNGTILPKNELHILKSYPIKDLQITLDGPEDLHNELRPLKSGNNAFMAIMQNVIALKAHGIPVLLRINFNVDSHLKVSELLDELKRKKLSDVPVEFLPIQAMTHACSGYEKAVSMKDLFKVLPKLWKLALDKGFNVSLLPRSKCVYCSASCSSSFVIDQELNLYKCAILQCDKKYSIGNLDDLSGNVVLKPEFYRWMNKDATRYSACSKCASLPICYGGCSGSGQFRNESYERNNCYEQHPVLLKKKIALYCLRKYPETVDENTINAILNN